MGTPAKADGRIILKSHSPKDKALVESWVYDANKGKLTGDFEGYYHITLLSYDEEIGQFIFDADSGRCQNLEWQMEMFKRFCEESPEIAYFESQVWVQGDCLMFDREEDIDRE